MPFVTSMDPIEIEALPEEKQGHGALKTAAGNLPLKAMDVEITVVGLLSKTKVRQTYVNALNKHLEATYIFPLPDRAGVSSFRLEVSERVIEGKLQERAKARQAYDQAIQAGHRAAIAEEERPDVFTMRVGNIPPGEEITVWLEMAGPLETSAGSASYRFPLVVAPRYIPGSALPGPAVGTGVALDTDQVPDASRITPPTLLPGHKSPVQLSLSMNVDPGGLETSNYRTSMEVEEENFEIFKLRAGERLNQDFVFRFDFLTQDLQASLMVERDEPGSKDGTLMLTVVGPDQREALPPKDVIFVLDRSGSMDGWKMVAARRACADLIDKLEPQDRFDVIAFDTTEESPFASELMSEATPHRRYVATEWLSGINARGGTEIARPLFYALKAMPDDSEREQTIVLITDGQVGNDRGVIKVVEKELGTRKIFTLGIDRAVNAGFLNALAGVGDGRCELVESPERLEEVLDSFACQIGGPYLEDMAFFTDGLKVATASVAPARGHHLYPNVPTMVCARFSGLDDMEKVKAGIAGVLPSIPVKESTTGALAPAWARRRLRELEDRWASASSSYGQLQSENPEVLERLIVETSLRHHVLCRFTAFVAIDKAEVVNKGGSQEQVTQPVERPEGWALSATPTGKGPASVFMSQAIGNMYGGGGVVMGQTCCSIGGQSLSSTQGVQPGFSGFAPGFEPMGRRSVTRTRRGPGGQSRGGGMRCVPIPAVGGTPDAVDWTSVLIMVKDLLKWNGKKGKKFWKKMKELSEALVRISGVGEAMISGSKAVSPVLRSSLNTAIAAKTWTKRTQKTLETIRDELETILGGGPRRENEAFWK